MIPGLNGDAITAVAEVLEYLNDPYNAFGIWVMASGIIAGAYFLSPALLTTI